jgi:hypothetical protein
VLLLDFGVSTDPGIPRKALACLVELRKTGETPVGSVRMNYMPIRVLITLVALVVIVIHGWMPGVALDAMTLGLLVVAIFPWLAPIVKTVELPGGWKVEFQEIKQEMAKVKGEIAEVKGESKSASIKAETALGVSGTFGAAMQGGPRENESLLSEVSTLASQYNNIRSTQPRGESRTRAMTDVVSKMIALASSLSQYKVSEGLIDKDRGKRLFAYSFLYAHPDFSKLDELLGSVRKIEDKPFGQFWGIQALGKVLDSRGSNAVGEDTKEELKAFLNTLGPGTDRYHELSRIVEGF